MMPIQEVMEEFIGNLVKNLVDVENDVKIEVSISTKAVIIQIKANKTDLGKVIGKKGRTIEAIKIIALAVKNTKFPGDNKGVSVEILEDEPTTYKRLIS